MAIKDQLVKLKDNWLIVLMLIIVLVFFMSSRGIFSQISGQMYATESLAVGKMAESRYYPPEAPGDFAPGVVERKIVKTANLGLEVENGKFGSAESRLKEIVSVSNSFLLNENVNTIGDKEDSYRQGSYQIKVDVKKYDTVLRQLKEIGDVKSFNENALDITGEYTNLEVELAAEKQRLFRFQEMYSGATNIGDQITLNDRIFDQERRVKYLEEALANKDLRVQYSTLYVSVNEEAPAYLNIEFVKFSELVRSLVSSINSLLYLIFVVLPYAVALFILWVIYRVVRNYME
ncbi:MAG TPA: DUF4349 domain-containing protein [Candidatus Nanoarchaeia archaeon]|nr:DUF4349 domain-containing protein [Candidatus Nanoarchaeia archaeon]